MIAENEAGFSNPSPPSAYFVALEPVGPPTDLHVLQITSNSVLVAWSPPTRDGGHSICDYILEKRLLPKGSWNNCDYEFNCECEKDITGLVYGFDYEFRVSARNVIGTLSEPSEICGPVHFRLVPCEPEVEFESPPLNQVEHGKKISLVAKISGSPQPDVTWYKDEDESLSNEAKISVENSRTRSVLKISDASREFTGTYKIKVVNVKGESSASVNLKVLDTPSQPGGPIKFTKQEANSVVISWEKPLLDGGADVKHYVVAKCDTTKLTWSTVSEMCTEKTIRVGKLIEGREYVFKVQAANQYGVGPALQSSKILAQNLYGVAGAPGKPEVLRTHFNSITIEWTAPENDGGSKIIGYHVDRMKNNGTRWARCNEEIVDDVHFRVTNLIEGALYQFRVVAVNSAGAGNPSPVSHLIECRLPPVPPGPPCVVRLVETTTTSATLEWEPPLNDNGSEVIGYVVEKKMFSAKDDCEWNSVSEEPVPENRIVVSGLKPEQNFEMRVKAVNRAGEGEPCELIGYVKPVESYQEPEFEVPETMKTHFTVFSGKNVSIPVSFKAKPAPDVEWKREDAENIDIKSTSTDVASTLELQDCRLSDAGKYSVTISNRVGAKKMSFKVKVIGAPGQVGPVTCKDVTSSSIVVNWSIPEHDGGEMVERYVVEKREATEQRWEKVISDCEKTMFKVSSGIQQGRSYVFRVTAVNKYGSGEERTTDCSYKATQVPSAPREFHLDEVCFVNFAKVFKNYNQL